MLQHEAALEQIKRTRLVAILRGIGSGQALDIASALYEGGVRALEFTFDHDDPDCVAHNCERIHAVRSRFPEDLLVGCGTALTVEEVEKSIAAGGQLVISPNTNVEVIRRTRELGAVSMPGALTPTEIVTAYEAGADLVKLFPAGELGVGYIRAVRGPLGHIPMTACALKRSLPSWMLASLVLESAASWCVKIFFARAIWPELLPAHVNSLLPSRRGRRARRHELFHHYRCWDDESACIAVR